jgi:hypothetical protein
VLGFELRAYTLSHSTNHFLWWVFFEIGSHELFPRAGFEHWSSWSLPLVELRLQAWATSAWLGGFLYSVHILHDSQVPSICSYDSPGPAGKLRLMMSQMVNARVHVLISIFIKYIHFKVSLNHLLFMCLQTQWQGQSSHIVKISLLLFGKELKTAGCSTIRIVTAGTLLPWVIAASEWPQWPRHQEVLWDMPVSSVAGLSWPKRSLCLVTQPLTFWRLEWPQELSAIFAHPACPHSISWDISEV